ncbi:MAG: membrane protein insertase YidC [Marinilabiliales bacterium]
MGKGLDKNTIIGMVVVFILIIGYSILTKPSKEEIEAAKRRQDSLAVVQKQKEEEQARQQLEKAKRDSINKANTLIEADSIMLMGNDTTALDSVKKDSILYAAYFKKYGPFANAARGKREYYIIENDKIKLKISNLGGRPYSVELKEYKRYDGSPLILFDGDSTEFGFSFFASNRAISTQEMFFDNVSNKSEIVVSDNPDSLIMRMSASENQYIEYVYVVYPGQYKVDFHINFHNLENVIDKNTNYIDLIWSAYIPGQEKGHKYENQYTAIYFKHYEDEVDYLSERKSDAIKIPTKLKWIAFKQQFFSSIFIADKFILSANLEQEMFDDTSRYLKHFSADMVLPFNGGKNDKLGFNFYFGPNQYNILRKQGKELQLDRLIPLGWSFFLMHWINRFIVIPVFNFLQEYISSYGLIILILTILLKIVLLPLTFKSYMSTAKMRVLKPQIDEINKKYPKEKAMERQQATMALYKKVGVSPFGGCLPMLLQFPILIAMFRFFPASIELRQQSFLWADDLSAYDSIVQLPFTVPFGYGDHVSLFTLLMTISTIIYTYINSKNTMQTQGMPGMKFMMYFMPVMFLFFFNNYAAALSYYYLLANLITFLQMYIFKKFVNDEEVLKKLEDAKKKAPAGKSKFMQRLEQAQKQQSQRKPRKK